MAIYKWISAVDDFVKLLFVLLHVTSGQPARATEWAAMTVHNPSGLGSRDVYISEGQIMLVPHYNKSRAVRLIARFPCIRTSALLITYLASIRFIYIVVVRRFYQDLEPPQEPEQEEQKAGMENEDEEKPAPFQCDDETLFLRQGKKCNAEHLRSAFETIFGQ